MHFHFRLRDLTAVVPWGEPDHLHLHWFGLTDGWYWLHIDEATELLRYNRPVLTHGDKDLSQATIDHPYVDYYVVRFWEDILEMLPAILEPLPPALAQLLATEENIHKWQQRLARWQAVDTLEAKICDARTQAVAWWWSRKLDLGYVRLQPHVWYWNDGHAIKCFWDNSQVFANGIPVWTAQKGQKQFSIDLFLDELDAFHTRLFAAMEERIREAKRSWPHHSIALDILALEKEQQDRSLWLTRAKERAAKTRTPWSTVLDALRTLESLPEFL